MEQHLWDRKSATVVPSSQHTTCFLIWTFTERNSRASEVTSKSMGRCVLLALRYQGFLQMFILSADTCCRVAQLATEWHNIREKFERCRCLKRFTEESVRVDRSKWMQSEDQYCRSFLVCVCVCDYVTFWGAKCIFKSTKWRYFYDLTVRLLFSSLF